MFIWWIIGSNSNWHFLIWLNIDWERSVSMSINIFVFRADFVRPKLRPARFLGLIFACFPNYCTKWFFVIFQDCILILDSPLSSYYERYDRSFRHFRRFRRFRSFVSFVRFEIAPVGMAAVVVGKRFGTADEIAAPSSVFAKLQSAMPLLQHVQFPSNPGLLRVFSREGLEQSWLNNWRQFKEHNSWWHYIDSQPKSEK